MAQTKNTQRNTRQKKAIHNVISASSSPKSIQEILELARDEVPRLSLGTVYRVVNAMVESKEAVLLQLPGEPPLYEKTGGRHHHHYRCRYCGKMYEIPGSEEILKMLTPEGCTAEFHELYISGKCRDCAAKDSDQQVGQ